MPILIHQNIKEYSINDFINISKEFFSIKSGIKSSIGINIQKGIINLKNLINTEYQLNNVPNLETSGFNESLKIQIENSISNNQLDSNFLNSLGPVLNNISGLQEFKQTKELNVKLKKTIKEISINLVFQELKNFLSDQEFKLGYYIYLLETSFSKDFFNFFIKNPGIDNLPFIIDINEMNEWWTMSSTNEFLKHISQIGLNSNLQMDYDSSMVSYYYVDNKIRNQSFQIRDQIKNSIYMINNVIDDIN